MNKKTTAEQLTINLICPSKSASAYEQILDEWTKMCEEISEEVGIRVQLENYISADGRLCYCTDGTIAYYYLLCKKHNIANPHWDGDFHITADEGEWGLNYCEGDIILWRKTIKGV